MQARDIYEEAIQTVITVRDFTQVFDTYAQFEKSSIASKMEAMEEKGSTDEGEHLLQVTDLQMKAIKELLFKGRGVHITADGLESEGHGEIISRKSGVTSQIRLLTCQKVTN